MENIKIKYVMQFIFLFIFSAYFPLTASANSDYICSEIVTGAECVGSWTPRNSSQHVRYFVGQKKVKQYYWNTRVTCQVSGYSDYATLDISNVGETKSRRIDKFFSVNWYYVNGGGLAYTYNMPGPEYVSCGGTETDSVLPSASVSYSTTAWTKSPVTITVQCNDTISGCTQGVIQKVVTQNGSGVIPVSDNAGNVVNVSYNVQNIDTGVTSLDSLTCKGLGKNNTSNSMVECNVGLSNYKGPSLDSLDVSQFTQDGVLTGPSQSKQNTSFAQTIQYNQYSYPCGGSIRGPRFCSAPYSYVDYITQNPKYNLKFTDNGTYTVKASGYDQAGNISGNNEVTFKIDTTNPSLSTSFDFNKWYNNKTLTSIDFVLKDQSASTTQNEETGLKSYAVMLNGQSVKFDNFIQTKGIDSQKVQLNTKQIQNLLKQGSDNVLVISLFDVVGNKTELQYLIKYDSVAPEKIDFQDKNANWRNDNIGTQENLTYVETSDVTSGLEKVVYSLSPFDEVCSDGQEKPPILESDGTYTVYACAKDQAGNVSKTSQLYKIDRSKPIVSTSSIEDIWYTDDVEIEVGTQDKNAEDPAKSSQMKSFKYIWDNAEDCLIKGRSVKDKEKIILTQEGVHDLYLCSEDNAGNTVNKFMQSIKLDKTNPDLQSNLLSSYIAGKNNINISQTWFDDRGKTDTTQLYRKNYNGAYSMEVYGPFKDNTYSGEVIGDAAVVFSQSGVVLNNKAYSSVISLTQAGVYKISYELIDKSGRTQKITKNITIYPAGISATRSSIRLTESVNSKIANNDDFYTYSLLLKDEFGNPIFDKSIVSINQSCTTSDCKKVYTNMVNGIGENALGFFDYQKSASSQGEIIYKVKSFAPGVFTQKFSIQIPVWSSDYKNTQQMQTILFQLSEVNAFKKPYIGKLVAYKNNVVSQPEIGTLMRYKLHISSQKGIDSTNFAVQNFGSSIKVVDSSTLFQGLSSIENLNTLTPYFDVRINMTQASSALGQAGVKLGNAQSNVIVEYILGGKQVSYYLSSDNEPLSRSIISVEGGKGNDGFTGLKVNGATQTDGKGEITGQAQNISDLSKNELRTTIRKNAYEFIKNLSSGTEVSGVKYVEGNFEIPSNPTFQTLVVKNGNAIISHDISQNVGIIVLQDNYNVKDGYLKSGNIYITPNVKNIQAILYADGGVMSVDNDKTVFVSDSTKRTDILSQQLFIKGNIFTRNTIGGALLSGGKYLLPGGVKTSDFNHAMIYDLNYVRRGTQGCTNNCKDAVIVEFNPLNQSNTPKLFGNK